MARTHVPSSHLLPGAAHVRVRLPHATDAAGIAELLRRLGLASDDLGAGRLLRFDPRRRAVVVAVAWIGITEVVAGLGAIDLHAGAHADLLLADETVAPGVGDLLAGVLAGRAQDRARRVA